MKYKAILFDLDGTLLDTITDLGAAANRVLIKRGFPEHPISAYREFVGEGARVLFAKALPQEHRDERLIDACLQDFLEDYSRNYMVASKPYHGIPELLDVLSVQGLKCAILSNKPDSITQNCVTTLLPKWKFAAVLGQREGVPRKPHPQGALEISTLLGIPPSDFLYVGDTAIDMKTAVSAGMFPVGVLWGFRPLKELKENGARMIVDGPLDILALL